MNTLHFQKLLLVLLSFICALFDACSKKSQSTGTSPSQQSTPAPPEKKPLTVKGFFIGMPRESINALLDSYNLTNRSYDSESKKTIEMAMLDHQYRLYVYYDQNDKLIMLDMDSVMIDYLFNVDRIDIKAFSKKFAESYNLPEMIPIRSGSYGWHYRDEIERLDVAIYRDQNGSKNLRLRKTPKRKFDVPVVNRPFTIKGFYLGMSKASALSQLNLLGLSHNDFISDDLEVKETMVPGGVVQIWYDKNDQLVRMWMNQYGTDGLFNVADLDQDSFAEDFKRNYGFAEMKPISDSHSYGWCYRDEKQGFEVTITAIELNGSKNLRFRRIPKTSEMKFN